jgi:uncharacterized membrane protein
LFRGILNDVHPPLYQVILKVWIDVFGNGETSVRALSYIFSIGTLSVAFAALRDRPLHFTSSFIVYLAGSSYFVFYAQEVRSYSALLFFATITVLIYVREEYRTGYKRFYWYLALLMTSLTHYFGLAYAGTFLLFDVFGVKTVRHFLEKVAIGALVLAWPVFHLLSGGLFSEAGGNFWITSRGISHTVYKVSQVINEVPEYLIGKLFSLPLPFSWFIPLAISFFSLLIAIKCLGTYTGFAEPWQMLLILGIIVSVVCVIDLKLPVSTPRNFVILTPICAILFAHFIHSIWTSGYSVWPKVLAVAVILCFYTISFDIGLKKMGERWEPRENWKALAEAVQKYELCSPRCFFVGPDKKKPEYEYYFDSLEGVYAHRVMRKKGELLNDMTGELPIIAAHVYPSPPNEITEKYSGWKCLQPIRDGWGLVYMLIDTEREIPELVQCSDKY